MKLTEKLMSVRSQIKALEEQEESLVQSIIEANHHVVTGQKTYDFEGRKVVITTKNNVTVEKSKMNAVYDECVQRWGEAFPINRAYAYTPRAKDLDAAMSDGSPELRKLLADVVTVKPAKPNVKVEL